MIRFFDGIYDGQDECMLEVGKMKNIQVIVKQEEDKQAYGNLGNPSDSRR